MSHPKKATARECDQHPRAFLESCYQNNYRLAQSQPPTQSLVSAVDRLIARALVLASLGLDCSPEIELARRLAAAAERRCA